MLDAESGWRRRRNALAHDRFHCSIAFISRMFERVWFARVTFARPQLILCCLHVLHFVSQSSSLYRRHECSSSCPAGYFQSAPCSNSRDRICSKCIECGGSSYEVRPCSPTSDRQCLHVAHPLLIAGEATTPGFLEEMKVEASENIFLEDLHSTRNLETTYYVTDLTQASDFYWDRESGIRVNIGILNVHLIPKYEDFDHDSDNKYMINNPNNIEDKTKFRRVVTSHCRHPIPDYYSITLEISRDRTTAAEEIACDSTNRSKPPCPPPLTDGDLYLHRTLNDACQRMGTFPDPLQPAGNSVVCTDNTELLRDIFNQTYSIERRIRFPSKKCRTAISRCEQCLNHPRCLAQDVFEKKCCQIDCYTLVDCKLMASRECTSAPVECAMGDAFRYTLQPVFQNIRAEFQCHLRHQRHAVLYELFYFIQVPGTDFQTPKVFTTVYAKDLDYQSRGSYQVDYLTVEHNTGLELKEEFILIGHENKTGSTDFTVHSLKMEDQFRRKRPTVHKISHNIFVSSTQFERPFDYSTSSWVRGNDCNKNISKMKVVQKHYGTDSQVVSIVTQHSTDQFEYFLKSPDNPPYLRFTVPGNMSILPFYFRNGGPYLLTKDTLTARLDLTTQGRIWEIHLAGKMSDCPAYLGLTINNRLELEELFRYDLLIRCPPEFNVTFKVPNWGQQPDKTFDIRLQDAVRSYDIYLTQLILESINHETEPGAMNVEVMSGMPVTMVAILAGALLVLVIMLAVAYIYKEFAKARLIYGEQGTSCRVRSSESPKREVLTGRQCIKHQKVLIAVYFIFWIVYSLTFTFTVLIALLSMALQADLAQLAQIDAFQKDMQNLTLATSVRIERHGNEELLQQSSSATGMQRACSVYIGELFEGVASKVSDLMRVEHLKHIHGANTSISHLFYERTRRQLDEYSRVLEKYGDAYRHRVESGTFKSISKYYRYLQAVLSNDWFSFPQLLLNSSEVDARHASLISEQRTGPYLFESDFGSFLEIEEVEDVKLWSIQFWQRFFNRIPNPLEFSSQVPNSASLHCTSTNITRQNSSSSSSSSRVQLDRLDSSRFYAILASLEKPINSKSKFSSVNIAEEHRLFRGFQSSDHHHNHQHLHLFSDEMDLFESVSIDVLRVVFLVLDALLLLHRFSNVYLNGVLLSNCLAAGGSSSSSQEVRLTPDHGHQQNGGRHIRSTASTKSRRNLPDQTRPEETRTANRIIAIRSALYQQNNRSANDLLDDDDDYDDDATTCRHKRVRLSSHPTTTADDTTTAAAAAAARHRSEAPTEGMAGVGVTETGVGEGIGQDKSRAYQLHSERTTKKTLMAKVLRSSVIPKVLLIYVWTVVFYVVVSLALSLLTTDALLTADLFGVYLGAINVQLNQTNWFLSDEAKHFNEVAMNFYQNQMNLELLNLQTLLEHFNTEQKRLIDNYLAEACIVKKLGQVNWTCDVSVDLPKLQIPMLPCNFMPIQSQFYSGFRVDDYEAEVVSASKSLLSSARSVVVYASVVGVCVVSVMLLVDICSSLLFHRVHHLQNATCSPPPPPPHPQRPPTHHPQSLSPPGGGHRIRRNQRTAEIVGDVIGEYDSDDCSEITSGLRGCPPTSGFSPDPVHGNDLTLTPTTDFKYSETKV